MLKVFRRGLMMGLLINAAVLIPGHSAWAMGETAVAQLKLTDGADAGTITFTEGTAGILLKFELKGLPPGPHGLHVHDTGTCEGDFSSAGAIYNPLGAKHGFLHEEGPMAGDLPNVHVGSDGTATGEMLSPFLTMSKNSEETLFDDNGSSIVIFEAADDYASDPDGAGGKRIACGTIGAK